MKIIYYIIFCFLSILFVVVWHPVDSHSLSVNNDIESYKSEIEDLKKSINEKEKDIEKLKEDSLLFESQISAKQKETMTLVNQLDIIRNKIGKIATEIRIKEKEIEKNTKEITYITENITKISNEIEGSKNKIEQYIRLIDEQDRKNILNALLLEPSFSSFFDQIEYTQTLHRDVQRTLASLKKDKLSLEEQKGIVTKKTTQLENIKREFESQKGQLTQEETVQNFYLTETKLSEEKFQQLLWRTKQEEAAIRNEISAFEITIRKKLETIEAAEKASREAGSEENFKLGSSRFIWPINQNKGITAEFHDPTYPFRHIFEHSGLDIRASQGTPIMAAESGYVARSYIKGKSFGYVMLIHGDGLSTLYGHVNSLAVTEDTYVQKGDIIAYSGGIPGTKGAGLSTGPHLHFEIRLNGIPVDPRSYLP